jgi:WXG100 family type VII secretion target
MRTRVQHDSVAELAAILALAVRGLEDELDQLDTATQQLRGAWDGAAREAYDRAHREWTASLTGMKDALADSTRRLIGANQTSLTTSGAAAHVWT